MFRRFKKFQRPQPHLTSQPLLALCPAVYLTTTTTTTTGALDTTVPGRGKPGLPRFRHEHADVFLVFLVLWVFTARNEFGEPGRELEEHDKGGGAETGPVEVLPCEVRAVDVECCPNRWMWRFVSFKGGFLSSGLVWIGGGREGLVEETGDKTNLVRRKNSDAGSMPIAPWC